MIEKLREGVELIHVGPTDALSPSLITSAIQRARSQKMYAKFYTDKYYIQVNFMKDGTMNVSSNINNLVFINDLRKRSLQGWTLATAKEFVYRWMQINRKMFG